MNTPKTAPDAQAFIAGEVSKVDVASIEKQLKALWQKSDGGGESGTIVRSASFNLIMFSSDDDAESKCSDILDKVLEHHPCRGILAVFRPDKPHQLSAWVSARCHLEGKTRTVCAEQITVCAEGGPVQELSSVVLPLILPDLPVFLWWRHPRIDRKIYAPLHDCSRRFIADTALDPYENALLKEVAELIQKTRACLNVTDLNWRRMNGWCRSIADAFDGFPLPPDQLGKTTRIDITYQDSVGHETISSSALLLSGWLASRLGWTPSAMKRGSSPTATFKAGDRSIEIAYKGVKSDVTYDGGLLGVGFDFSDKRTLDVKLEPTDDLTFVVARADGSDEKEVTRTDHNLDEATLVGMEVEVMHGDKIYEKAVEVAAAMIDLWGK